MDVCVPRSRIAADMNLSSKQHNHIKRLEMTLYVSEGKGAAVCLITSALLMSLPTIKKPLTVLQRCPHSEPQICRRTS